MAVTCLVLLEVGEGWGWGSIYFLSRAIIKDGRGERSVSLNISLSSIKRQWWIGCTLLEIATAP